jgi:tetratricopeptide (TPR) repeat protein
MKLGFYDLAINDFNEVLILKPNFSASQYNMGLCFLKLKKYPEALQLIENASKADTSIKANTALAECYFYAGKNQTAIKYFNAALKETPDSVGLFLGRGLAHYQLGLVVYSKSDLSNYLQKGGVNAIAFRQLGLIYLKTADTTALLDSAILFLEQFKTNVTILDKESSKAMALAYLLRGKMLMNTEKQVEAMADFSKVIELEPANAEALLQRGKILISVGQNIEGCLDLQNALKNGNKNAEKLISVYCNEVL